MTDWLQLILLHFYGPIPGRIKTVAWSIPTHLLFAVNSGTLLHLPLRLHHLISHNRTMDSGVEPRSGQNCSECKTGKCFRKNQYWWYCFTRTWDCNNNVWATNRKHKCIWDIGRRCIKITPSFLTGLITHTENNNTSPVKPEHCLSFY